MKLISTSCCLSIAIVCSGLTALDWDSSDDKRLTQMVTKVVSGDNKGKIHRVTKTPFKMHPSTTALCRIPTPVELAASNAEVHADRYCHVYVNEPALKPMRTGQGTYPEGSLIIKQKYSDVAGTKTELFTVMRKMPKGYDAENGDWEYSVINSTASKILSRGRTDSCIQCHTEYEHTDYVTRSYMLFDR